MTKIYDDFTNIILYAVLKEQNSFRTSGDNAMKVTPVPIPNTTVKLHRADGTAGEALWESRTLPGLYSAVAQWWSTRLLTDRLEVRALSAEPRKKHPSVRIDKRVFFSMISVPY